MRGQLDRAVPDPDDRQLPRELRDAALTGNEGGDTLSVEAPDRCLDHPVDQDAEGRAPAVLDVERIDVRGARDYTFMLTAAAKARGWDAAFGPGVLRLEPQGGRGKTSHSDEATKQAVLSTKEGQSGRGERHCPATNDLPVTMRLAEPPEPCEWLRSA